MNIHTKFNTTDHHHFDFMYSEGEEWIYPKSGLMLVGCVDGRWFLQQEFGTEYGDFAGVVKSDNDMDTQPQFYPDVDAAAHAAFALIEQVYPTVDRQRLQDFLES